MVFTIQELRDRIGLPEGQEWCYTDFLETALSSFEQITCLKWGAVTDGVITTSQSKCFGSTYKIPAALVASISLVETKCRADSTWTTIESTSYVLNGRRLTYTGTGTGFLQMLRVTYSGGYDGDTRAPGNVRMAIMAEIRFLLVRLASERIALRTQAGNGASSVYEDGEHAPYFLMIANSYSVVL